MIRLDRQDIREEAEYIQANEGTNYRRFSWAERFAAGVIIQLCNQLGDAEVEVEYQKAEIQKLQSTLGREIDIIYKIIGRGSPASIYWIKGKRVICNFCDFEGVLDADVVHDEKCPLVQLLGSLKETNND